MSAAGLEWLEGDWPARAAAILEGAGLDDPQADGDLEVVFTTAAGRPRRSRRAGAAQPAADPGEVRVTVGIDAGRVVSARSGPSPEPVARLLVSGTDALGVVNGTVQPSVLFMQGKLKVDGDMRMVLAVLRATSGEGFSRACAALAPAGGSGT